MLARFLLLLCSECSRLYVASCEYVLGLQGGVQEQRHQYRKAEAVHTMACVQAAMENA